MGPGVHVLEAVHGFVEWSALLIEMLAVATIMGAVVVIAIRRGTVRYLFHLGEPGAFESYKHQLARPMLLGLDLLVAADIVQSVAVESTLVSLSVLGLLVLIRTFLSWTLTMELGERPPWQTRAKTRV